MSIYTQAHKCENCRFHCYDVNDEQGREPKMHQCRAYAPAHFSGSGMGYDAQLFPRVQPDMFCGEWSPTENWLTRKGEPDNG